MKFFFPDSHDLVDPSFDFETERRSASGSRQLSHQYAHEVLGYAPYDGMLLSKAMVDDHASSKGVRYSFTQVQRLKRLGIREFLRLDIHGYPKRIETMGDCGSFSFVNEPEPPFGTDAVAQFYLDCQFDYGISLDHVILGYLGKDDGITIPEEFKRRFDITLQKAEEFLIRQQKDKLPFKPIGAAQGWSPNSYRDAVDKLQKMGYDYIALGGMVPLKTPEILDSLEVVNSVRKSQTKIHLLGISRLENIDAFKKYGVTSFDSTSPLKKAFMDDKDNYHTPTHPYTAIRVPQVDGNPQLKKLILSGKVDFATARKLEVACMTGIREYDAGSLRLDSLVSRLQEYEALWHGKKDDSEKYRTTLVDKPWKSCSCQICKKLGIHVVLFRGADRNRRRGFHNLHSLRQKINQIQSTAI